MEYKFRIYSVVCCVIIPCRCEQPCGILCAGAVYAAGVVAVLGVCALSVFCLLSVLQLAMVASKDKVVCSYVAAVITKLVLAILAGQSPIRPQQH